MRRSGQKPRLMQQYKSFNFDHSGTNVFSRVQSLFLQKFFRYNLSDYFYESLASMEQEGWLHKIKSRAIRQLSAETFAIRSNMDLHDFTSRIGDFYRMEGDRTVQGFRFLYSNVGGEEGSALRQDQLMMVQVRMGVDVGKIEEIPRDFYRSLELVQEEVGRLHWRLDEEVLGNFKGYAKKAINLVIVYFGDTNFQVVDKQNYAPREVELFNHSIPVKIFVFYVSRLAMIDKFKRINRIGEISYINDLLIQLYEFRREKVRSRRAKQRQEKSEKAEGRVKMVIWLLKWISLVSIAGLIFAFLFLKYFYLSI